VDLDVAAGSVSAGIVTRARAARRRRDRHRDVEGGNSRRLSDRRWGCEAWTVIHDEQALDVECAEGVAGVEMSIP
jgi:hypothetical protein